MAESRSKRRHIGPITASDVPPPSHRVLAIPELLSLIFGFLAHTDLSTDEDSEISSFSAPHCPCSCSQCLRDHPVAGVGATGLMSFPSPFSMPRSQKESEIKKEDEERDVLVCHCTLPAHRQLSTLFGRACPKKPTSTPNQPSFNYANALVCKAWSSVALDVLWRVVDRPERLFALLDGAWGLEVKNTGRLSGLRGLRLDVTGRGRIPSSWEPGVQAFLRLQDDEEALEEEEDAANPRQYELFSFKSPPTPASWTRFDRYSRRVRHLVYTRPCLSETAMNQIAVTRPRLSVLTRMHSLTWADNPINHAVLFMHEGVRRLELRIEVFGSEKVDPRVPAEQTSSMYTELGLDNFVYDTGVPTIGDIFQIGEEEIKPNRSISRTLATQLAEIPRRMPGLQTLCLSSYIPVSLYLPALLCTLFRDDDEMPTLRQLRHLVLPRYYTCAPLLDRIAHLSQLETLEFQFDDALGWGRASDVGLKKCAPENWKLVSDADSSESQSTIFAKLDDLNLTIPLTDARDLFLLPDSTPDLTSTPGGMLPCWPQNLVCICIDAPPGLLATPMEIKSVFQAIALACYGPSTGKDRKPARLERVALVCCADPDSGYYDLTSGLQNPDDAVALSMTGKCLTRAVFDPLLEHLGGDEDNDHEERQAEEGVEVSKPQLRPKFALKAFEITHHFPLEFTQGDVEFIAERWGGCIETLILNCEPIAAFGITKDGGLRVDSVDKADRPEASLTLGALLPFARHCTELRQLGLFVDATRGVKGLMKAVLAPGESTDVAPVQEIPTSDSEEEEGDEQGGDLKKGHDLNDFDVYTARLAQRYLQSPLSHPRIPNAFPVFEKLERLSFGTSLMSVTLDDTKLAFSTPGKTHEHDSDSDSDSDDPIDKAKLMSALRGAAQTRLGKDTLQEAGHNGPPSLRNLLDEHYFLFDYMKRRGVRLGLIEEDEVESDLLDAASKAGLEDTSDLVPMFLAQVLPCFPAQPTSDLSTMTSSAFTTVVEAGTTWSGSPSGLMSSSRAIQAYYTVGSPYELDKAKRRRRLMRERRLQQEHEDAEDDGDDDDQQTQPQPASQQSNLPGSHTHIGTTTAAGSSDDNNSGPPVDAVTTSALSESTLVVPFDPIPPLFMEPSLYLPLLLISVYRARIRKWLAMNNTVLPMAVAMREAGWVWGGRVAKELGKRREEVDELSVRVGVMNGLVKARSARGGGAKGNVGDGPDGCVIC